MPLFPRYFRLSETSERAYRLWLEGDALVGPPGPEGPQGPTGPSGSPGLGLQNYEDFPVDLQITLEPIAATIFRVLVEITEGPNRGVVSYPHQIPNFSSMFVLAMHGSLTDGGGNHYPLPFVYEAGMNSPVGSVAMQIREDNIILSSDENWSAFYGWVQIDYAEF